MMKSFKRLSDKILDLYFTFVILLMQPIRAHLHYIINATNQGRKGYKKVDS